MALKSYPHRSETINPAASPKVSQTPPSSTRESFLRDLKKAARPTGGRTQAGRPAQSGSTSR
jgi:hypothetical protein